MKYAAANIESLIQVALALGDLNERVAFVGGAVVGLYANDPAADDVRPTKDIDITIEITTLLELEQLRQKLVQKGFRQTVEDVVTCRFRLEEIIVDVMSTQAVGWAPTNPWFAPGFERLEQVELKGIRLNILPLEYFLASKFVAFVDRGKSDPFGSHDFEDIIYILDNRMDLVNIFTGDPDDVSVFLMKHFNRIILDKNMQEAILGNLPYKTQQGRFKIIMEKLQAIIREKN